MQIKIQLSVLALLTTLLLSGCGDAPTASWPQTQLGLYDAALSADGRYSLIATLEQGAELWDLNSGEKKTHWQSDKTTYLFTALSADGRIAATAGRKLFQLWNTQSEANWLEQSSPVEITAIALNQEGSELLLGLADGRIQVFNNSAQGVRLTLRHEGRIGAVAFSDDGEQIISGSNDNQARVWSARTGELLQNFSHEFNVDSVALSPDNRLAFSSAGQYQSVLWDVASGQALHQLTLRGEWARFFNRASMTINLAQFSADGQALYTASPPNFVRRWQVTSARPEQQWTLPKRTFWKPPGNIVYAMALDKDKLTVSGADGVTYAFRLTPNATQ